MEAGEASCEACAPSEGALKGEVDAFPVLSSLASCWPLTATCRFHEEALQIKKLPTPILSPQAFSHLEALDSSNRNSAAQICSCGLGKAGQKAARRLPHHLPSPSTRSSLAPRSHEGTIRAKSLREPLWPSGVQGVSRDTLPIPPGPSAPIISPLEASRGLFSCWFSMIS